MLGANSLEGLSLKKYSVNPRAEARLLNRLSGKDKIRTLEQNLDSYVNHVLEDNVVSLPYSYGLSKDNEILIHDTGQKVFLDERERGGLYKEGLIRALTSSVENPGLVSLLYSPPGITSFDGDPDNPYTQVGKYRDGQLYVMYYDGGKIRNAAISVSKNGEPWVQDILGDVYSEASGKQTEQEKIGHLISHPNLTRLKIDQFIEVNGRAGDRTIYKNNKDYEFSLFETMELLRQSFSGSLRLSIKNRLTEAFFKGHEVDEQFILNSYKHLILHYMESHGLESLRLSGSCGSEEKFKINDLMNTVDNFLNNFSSLDRLLKQKMPKGLEEDKDDKSHDFYSCPHCTQPIPYEKNVKDKNTWLTNCPHCGLSIKNVC